MSPKKKPQQSLADYVTIALSPALIMMLVGSLVFFLLEVLYVGQYSGRMQWTLFFFVFGIVLVARIAIQLDGGRALLYGLGLAVVVWLALQTFIEYPRGSPVRALSWAINAGLIGLAWWCANRLTWDCTYIDDSVDITGKGVLEAAGLDAPTAEEQEEAADDEAPSEEEPAERKPRRAPPTNSLIAWWDRYCHYRAEQLRKPHTPGVWVVYFSLAALPLFGLGQALIPAADAGRRRYAFWLLICYVGSGLALLVTTSFLGLRRYLRQRKLKMPAAMTGLWMGLSAALIVLLMAAAALIPRPYGEYQLVNFRALASAERNASSSAILREGAGKGEGRPSSTQARPSQDASATSSKQRKDGQGQAGKGEGSGKEGKAQQGKSEASKESQSGQADGKPDNAPSGEKGEPRRAKQQGKQQASADAAESERRREREQNRPNGNRGPDKEEPANRSDSGQPRDEPSSTPPNLLSEVVQKLGWLGTLLKWLVFGILALVTLFIVLRGALQYLANFTNWARQLLDALRAWWEGLFAGSTVEPDPEGEMTRHFPRPRPFASFTNPFLDGRAEQLSVEAVTRYSFEALQAWAWERGLGRQTEETPLEFAERLARAEPELEAEVRSVTGLYARLAYAQSALPSGCTGLLKRFWQRLGAVREKPVSV